MTPPLTVPNALPLESAYAFCTTSPGVADSSPSNH